MRRSDLLFHAGGECVAKFGTIVRRTSPDDDNGYTHVRGSTQSYNIGGTTYWAADNVPTITYYSGEAALRLTTGDTFYADYPHAPQAMTLYAKCRETGVAGSTSPRTLVSVSNAGSSGPYVQLYWNAGGGGRYSFHFTGSTTEQEVNSVAWTDPSTGQTFELLGSLSSSGFMRAALSINGAAEQSATASAIPLPTAWGGQRVYVGSLGATRQAQVGVFAVKIARGVRTLAEMRGL